MVFIVDGQRIATENFLVGQLYKIIYKNENIVYAMCDGIGHDFVMFISDNPRIITLNIETAQTIDAIMPAEAGSMYDYNDLINKPTINNVALIGNLTSSELGLQTTLNTAQMAAVNSGIDTAAVEQIATNTTAIGNKQDVIDTTHKLSADLVDDSSSTQKFATAAQLSQIATNTTAIAGKQNTIDSSHKLSADLVDDSSSTQKFATAAQLAQIGTNETNILSCKEFTDNATIDSNRKLYISATEPTGNIPEGSTWINGKEIKTYTVSNNLLNQTVQPENIYITASIRRMGYDVPLSAGTYSIYGNDATLYAKTKIDGVYGDAVQINEAQTLTLANDGSILVYCSTVNEFPQVNIMLNVGSQILPYEPYGSTWS